MHCLLKVELASDNLARIEGSGQDAFVRARALHSRAPYVPDVTRSIFLRAEMAPDSFRIVVQDYFQTGLLWKIDSIRWKQLSGVWNKSAFTVFFRGPDFSLRGRATMLSAIKALLVMLGGSLVLPEGYFGGRRE